MVSRSTPFDPRFAVKQRLGFRQRLGFLVLSVTTNPNPTCTTSVEKLHNGYPGHEKNTFRATATKRKHTELSQRFSLGQLRHCVTHWQGPGAQKNFDPEHPQALGRDSKGRSLALVFISGLIQFCVVWFALRILHPPANPPLSLLSECSP